MTLPDIDTKKIEDIIRHVSATEVYPRFKNLAAGDIREKNPGDFVTVADEASEKAFTALLSEALPGSDVVGEEAVSKDKAVLDKLKAGKPVWVIDPIDGTYNFSHNRSKFGILIALVQNGVTQYGFAYDVPGNRMAVAQKGAGAFIDGAKLQIDQTPKSLSDMTLHGGGAQAWHFDPIRPDFKDVINIRCSLHDFMDFYTNTIDGIVHLNKATPWDHAANILITQEAGGYVGIGVDDIPYDPTYFGPTFLVAAANKATRQKILDATYEKLQKKKQAS